MVRRASWPSAGLLLRLPGRSTEPIGIEHIWRAAGGMRRASPRHRDESRRPRRPGPTTTGSNHRHSCRRARWPVDCARDWRAGAAAASFSLRVDGGVDNVCTGRLGRAPSAEREYDRHQVGCAVGRAGGQSCDGGLGKPELWVEFPHGASLCSAAAQRRAVWTARRRGRDSGHLGQPGPWGVRANGAGGNPVARKVIGRVGLGRRRNRLGRFERDRDEQRPVLSRRTDDR